jgi:hypothetical protein
VKDDCSRDTTCPNTCGARHDRLLKQCFVPRVCRPWCHNARSAPFLERNKLCCPIIIEFHRVCKANWADWPSLEKISVAVTFVR